MEDLSAQVQSILNDPAQMARVMELAGRLGLGPEAVPPPSPASDAEPSGPDPGAVGALLRRAGGGGRTGAVLRSLSPLLPEEKRPQLEKAIRAAALSGILRTALASFGTESGRV